MRNEQRFLVWLAVLVAVVGGCQPTVELPPSQGSLAVSARGLASPRTPVMVKDIFLNRSPSNPSGFADFNGTVFFLATDVLHGDELWKSDGTRTGTVLVKDMMPGPDGSAPYGFTRMGNTLYFIGSDPTGYGELWKTDGTEVGTVLITNLFPGIFYGPFPEHLTDVNGTLFFVVDSGSGPELWKSDGTEAGTLLVKHIAPGGTPLPRDLTNVNGTLFFVADDGVTGAELWKSDGTEAGTVLVKDLYPGSVSSQLGILRELNGQLLFVANTEPVGFELWRSDGTEAGTVLVRSRSSSYWALEPPVAHQFYARVGSTLFFLATDDANGHELWKSDGTEAGTVLVKDIWPGPYGGGAQWLTDVNGTLFFATSISEGYALWKSDGTEAGTVFVANMGSGLPLSWGDGDLDRVFLAAAGNKVYFVSQRRVDYYGYMDAELWRSDGTAAGTVLVKDIWPGIYGSQPRYPVSAGGRLFFTADDGVHGYELWTSDGTEAGTRLVSDINEASEGSFPFQFSNVNGTLLFSASDYDTGWELWKSDGTEAGTVRVKDIRPGGMDSNAFDFTEVNGTLFFSAIDGSGDRELWKSDGTEVGTVRVKDIRPGSGSSNPDELVNVNGTLFFSANDFVNGAELWKSDGTESGTVRVKDIVPGSDSSAPMSLTHVKGVLFFSASDPAGGRELWKSDGTEAGTVRVKDIRPGSEGSFPNPFFDMDGTAFFVANDGTGAYLWKSDGSEAGTVRVSGAARAPSEFTRVGDTLFFSAHGPAGQELWKTDGTEAGTVLVKDIWPGGGSSAPINLTNVNGALFFAANDGTNGVELWKSDGTEAGTVRVKDIWPGASGSAPEYLFAVDDLLLFGANDGVHGKELWMSDGTDAGTRMLADLAPGSTPSSPSRFFRFGDAVFFRASDLMHGQELWRLVLAGEDTTPPTVTCPGPVVSAEATSASGAAVMYPPATALDDVSPSSALVLVYDPASGSTFPLGDTSVSFLATDEAGNSAGCGFTVRVSDTTPPTLTCSKDVTAEATSADGATVEYPAASASDGVSAVRVEYSQGSGTRFPRGATPVTVTAKDAANNTRTCGFTVTVKDPAPPSITCPESVMAEAMSATGATVTYPPASVSGLAPVSVTYSRGSGEAFPLGSTEVTATVRDALERAASCGFTVTVKDTTAPALKCPVPMTVEATSAAGAIVTWPAVSAEDAVSSVKVTSSVASGTTFARGTTTVTLTAKDEAGNASTCDFTVTVKDTTAPALSCPADVRAEATSAAGASVDFPAATATDAVSSPVVPTYSHTRGDTFPLGMTRVTATAKDEAGNTSTCDFFVVVKDSTAPELSCPGDVVAEATEVSGAHVIFSVPAPSDAVTTSPSVMLSHVSGSLFPLGTTKVVATAKDEAGNSASCDFTVTVRDTTAPALTCGSELVAEATGVDGTDVAFVLPVATDAVTSSPTVAADHAPGSLFPLGTTRVSVTATDEAGNSASCGFTVTVRDTTAPEIGCPGNLTAEAVDAAGAHVVFSAPAPRDAITASPSVTISHAPGSLFPLGTTEVVATATDEAGNSARCGFTVTVRDTTAPVLTCPADVTVRSPRPQGTEVEYSPATASDAVSTLVLQYSQASGSVFPRGATPVTVTATDSTGNASTCTFQVTVQPQYSQPTQASVGCSSTAGAPGFGWSGLLLLSWAMARRRIRGRE